MNNIIPILCGCAICVGALGCTCSRDVPPPAPRWSARTADSEPDEPAAPVADEADVPATAPTVEPPEEAAAECGTGRQATAPQPAPEADDAPAQDAQPAAPPGPAGVPGVEVIAPPSKAGRPAAQDARELAAEVEGHLQAAQSLAQQRRFGEACSRLLAAYEALEAGTDANGEMVSHLRAAVLEKLEAYGEQANRAAGGDAAGRTLGKPLSIQ